MNPSLIHDEACVEANVKVAPDVKIKNIQSYFVGDPVVESRDQNPPECSYAVSQMICVKYSLAFAADVQAEPSGIICNPQIVTPGQHPFSDVLAGPSVTVCKQESNERLESQAVPDVRTAPETVSRKKTEEHPVPQAPVQRKQVNAKSQAQRFIELNRLADKRKADFNTIAFQNKLASRYGRR